MKITNGPRSCTMRLPTRIAALPNNTENSENAFMSTPNCRAKATNRSIPVRSVSGGKNCWKIEIRKTVTTFMAITPYSAMPRTMSTVSMRSDLATGPIFCASAVSLISR